MIKNYYENKILFSFSLSSFINIKFSILLYNQGFIFLAIPVAFSIFLENDAEL